MKKVIFALMASAMLVACGGNGTSTEATTDSTSVDSSAVVADSTAVETPQTDSPSVQ